MATTSKRIRARLVKTRRDTAFLLSGAPLWVVPLAVMSVPWTYTLRGVYGNPTSMYAITFAVVIPGLFVFFFLPWLTTWQRRRIKALRGVTILDADAPRFTFRREQARFAMRSETVWRQMLYHAIVGPAVGLGVLLAGTLLITGLVLLALWPGQRVLTGRDMPTMGGVIVIIVGLLSIAAIPWLIGLLARGDTEAARRLLGPSQTVELTRRVEVLAASRAAAVEAADAERRRIERDLHDGAQQQLMSLAMKLGIARKTLRDVPDDVMSMIVEAHEQAKEAMAQLRDLVRGMHPAVLDDRGLDAALSGIAARSAVPVRLTVDTSGPISASVETVAYFVVSEALANVVKHSQASQATVDVLAEAELGWLQVRIADDGIGGADAAGGTGLDGLEQRVATVDGTLRISSPVGGPTVVTAMLPCGVLPAAVA